MSLEEQIIEWSASRPDWQRAIIRRVAIGDVPSEYDYDEIVEKLLASKEIGDKNVGLEQLSKVSIGDPPVRLVSMSQLEHVNAISSNNPLTFELTGLNIIYGDNASGKSGYARLLKRIARARHREDILSDVFRDTALAKPKAALTVRIGDEEVSLTWPDSSRPELQRILFYDQACGNAYIATESEFPYRPSALFVLDGLINACVAIRDRIESKLEENAGLTKPLPAVDADMRETVLGKYLTQICGSSSLDELDRLLSRSAGSTETVVGLKREEARLRNLDTTNERNKLRRNATKVDTLKAHLNDLQHALGDGTVIALQGERDALKSLEEAEAVDLRAKSFESEPLAAVGSSAWKELWEAARRYSEAHAYAGNAFPVVTKDARCVLCQQVLKDEAPERFSRFESFIKEDTQTRLHDARERWNAQVVSITDLRTIPEVIDSNLRDLEADHAEVIQEVRRLIAEFEDARLKIVDSLGVNGDLPRFGLSSAELISQLEAIAQSARTAAADLSDQERITERLNAVEFRRKELEFLQEVKSKRALVADEIERLKEREALEAIKNDTATGPITKKVLDLSEENITEVVRNTFIRETERLHLDRITIAKTRGDRGSLLHQPKLVGARQSVTVSRVFSEGERTALGLAAFFTEAHLDASRSALILDDPVTSLDSSRRELVAARLAALAETRQVIVFTHDVALVADLKREARGIGVNIGERSVTRARGGDKKPGECGTTHPWKAKDVTERLGELRSDLARLKRESSGWDEADYEKEVASWAGNLSETWERIFSQELIGPLLAEGGLEVRPIMVKILTRFSDDDEREFQASYSRVSRWAKRHDKSSLVNYIAPDTATLEQELELVSNWFKRVKAYKNS